MKKILFVAIAVLGIAASAAAVPLTITVGDNDGYGLGCADNGPCVWDGPGVPSGENMDHRSAAEAAAVNGAQITDVYSAVFPGSGPNASAADVLFPLSGQTITSASLTIDMGDFQSSTFRPLIAAINGVPIPFSFDDGFRQTAIRSFTLDAAMLAAANLSGVVDLHIDRDGSTDFVAFDYFQLNAEAVPEPASLLLLGTGLIATRFRRRNA